MQRIDEVLEKTLAHIDRGDTAEQRRRNQQNIVRIRKMIDAARYNEKTKRLV